MRYRIVFFEPDPFTGARWPLGAVVDHGDGRVSAVQAGHVPGACCIGSSCEAVLARRLHARVGTITDFDQLPTPFGPYSYLGEARQLPPGVTDPLGWVASGLPKNVEADDAT